MADLKNFEKNMKRLEEIVEVLEGGEIDLEKSLSAYTEATKLIKECSSVLDKAEKQIKLLSKDDEGQPVVTDFDVNV